MAPPKKDTEAINLRLPRELIEAIDDRRRVEPDLPTRPEWSSPTEVVRRYV